MTATFLHSIREAGEAGELVVLDRERRLYAGLNREQTGWHIVQPAQLWDPRVGDGLAVVGQLVCSCQGGVFRGVCYRTKEARAFEARQADQAAAPSWLRGSSSAEVRHERLIEGLDNPAGAGEAVEAARG